MTIRKRKPLTLVIIGSICAIGLVSSSGSSLAYAYLTIISPTEGQQIPAGSTFNIKGTSTAANDTNHCVVSVIINGIRPYQKTIPTGTNGTEDYTSWQFIGGPGYATVKLGQNKITGKYSCFPNTDTINTQPNFVKYHSVNVTGIGQQLPQQTSSSPSSPQQTSSSPSSPQQTSSSPSSPSALTPSSNGATTGKSGGNIVNEPKHSKIIR